MIVKTIGVLALQGDFAKHIDMLKTLGVNTIEVRKATDLDLCDGLIIPGGESTVMLLQLDFIGMRESLKKFIKIKPVFGTCAGLILLSNDIQASSMTPLAVLDVSVERNAFGRQIDSFETDLEVSLSQGQLQTLPVFFIRAPRIRRIGSNVVVLAIYQGEPVLVRQGNILGASFHPELTNCNVIHKFFVDMA